MATATAPRRAPAPVRVPDNARPRFEVVGPPSRRRFRWSGRHAIAVAVGLVVGSLLLVAGAQAYMTQQQVRLTAVQARLSVQTGNHRDLELRVAQLSNPSHVVSAAQRQGLTVPAQVTDLPPVAPLPSTNHRSHGSSSRKAAAHSGSPPAASGGSQK